MLEQIQKLILSWLLQIQQQPGLQLLSVQMINLVLVLLKRQFTLKHPSQGSTSTVHVMFTLCSRQSVQTASEKPWTKPFFVEFDLPKTMIRSEIILVPVSFFTQINAECIRIKIITFDEFKLVPNFRTSRPDRFNHGPSIHGYQGLPKWNPWQELR